MNPYIGNEFQISGVEEYVLSYGKKDGMRMFHVKNGLGLELYVSLDRGGDITALTYKGTNLSYLSPNGYVRSVYYDDKKDGWLKSFTAGFLTTCGLANVGSSNVDNGEELPLHGSISQLPVENANYDISENEIIIKTTLLDETIFGSKFKRIRYIKISKKVNEFTINDEIINQGDNIEPFEYLFHFNIGYPLLTEKSELYISSNKVMPRNKNDAVDIANYLKIEPPTRNYIEKCYYHEMLNGYAAIYNKDLNIGLKINYNCNELDCFTEWKMMGYRDYVLGLEPGNATPDGRSICRKNGILKFISPDEIKKYEIRIKIFENITDLKEKKIC